MKRFLFYILHSTFCIFLASCSLDTPTQIPRDNPWDARNPNAVPEVLSLSSSHSNAFINQHSGSISIQTKAASTLRYAVVSDSGEALTSSWMPVAETYGVTLQGADGWRWIAAQARADNGRESSVKYLRLGLDTRAAISSFAWSATGGDTLIPGDRVTFTMLASNDAFGAETGGRASVTVEGWQPIALTGQAGGIYSASYTITDQTPRVSNARVTASFTDRAGNAVPAVASDQRLNAYWMQAGEERDFPLGATGLTIRMCWIPAGSFNMGSPNGEQDRDSDEGPVHRVTFARGFWMSKYEITQRQWEAVMGNWYFNFDGNPDNPAEQVSWNDIQNFETALGNALRLPSESEWEYACRAGTTTRFYWGDDPSYSQIGTYAWYISNSSSRTHPVGEKTANAWGLCDMSGNVWEWCEDWYHDSYNGAPADGSAWTAGGGTYRVLRGGSWSDDARSCRSANRTNGSPNSRNHINGFRVVRSGG